MRGEGSGGLGIVSPELGCPRNYVVGIGVPGIEHGFLLVPEKPAISGNRYADLYMEILLTVSPVVISLLL